MSMSLNKNQLILKIKKNYKVKIVSKMIKMI